MRVILKEDVFKLGSEGSICEVKDGYARNFLIPKGIAVFANKNNLEVLRQKKRALEKKRDIKIREAQDLREKVEGISLNFIVKSNEQGKVFSSINNTKIAEELHKKNIDIERKRIEVPQGIIKSTGKYIVLVKIYEDIIAKLNVEIKDEKDIIDEKREEEKEISKKNILK